MSASRPCHEEDYEDTGAGLELVKNVQNPFAETRRPWKSRFQTDGED